MGAATCADHFAAPIMDPEGCPSMLGKLMLPGVIVVGFFLFTHQPARPRVAVAYVAQSCSTAQQSVEAAFAWPPSAAGVDQTWVDVGLEPAFLLGWYQGHGPLPPDQNTLSVSALSPGLKYHYRVHTLAGGTWHITASGSFIAACAAPAPAPSAALTAESQEVSE